MMETIKVNLNKIRENIYFYNCADQKHLGFQSSHIIKKKIYKIKLFKFHCVVH